MSIVTLNNRALKDATEVGTTTGLGNLVFISRSTASSSSTVDITSNINSTHKEYIFFFNNMHPSSASQFAFNGTDDTSSHSFDITKTTTLFMAAQREDGGANQFSYQTGSDLAQGTGYQRLANYTTDTAANDSSISGFLHLFDPSNTTFVKHFIANTSNNNGDGSGGTQWANNSYTAGYFNTTSAITGLSFKFESGNIDSGTIDMYGVK